MVLNKDAFDRQKIVLMRMHELGYIDDKEYERAKNYDIVSAINPRNFKNHTMSTYSTDYIKKEASKYLADFYKTTLEEGEHKLFTGGYKVYSTIDEEIQKNLEDKFLQESFENLKKKDPFMLATQFEKYFVCKSLTYEETLNLDLKVLNYAVDTRSMNEGIKSKIIEKGYEPKWKCKSLDDVSLEKVKKLLKVEETYRERKD